VNPPSAGLSTLDLIKFVLKVPDDGEPLTGDMQK